MPGSWRSVQGRFIQHWADLAQPSTPGRRRCPSPSWPSPGGTEDCLQWPLFTLPEEQNWNQAMHFKPFVNIENNKKSTGDWVFHHQHANIIKQWLFKKSNCAPPGLCVEKKENILFSVFAFWFYRHKMWNKLP